MLRQLHSKVIFKCLLTGVIMMFTGIILQVGKAQLFLKKEPPELGFILGVVVAYTLVGFLFSMGFYLFRNALPGKTVLQKSLFHSLLAIITVLIPGILGMTAFDFDGLFNLFTARKIEEYSIALIDVINFSFGAYLLARFFKEDTCQKEPESSPKSGLFMGMIIGSIMVPLLMLVLFITVQGFMPIGLDIPSNALSWFYTGFFAPLVITGAMLSVFYHFVKNAFPGTWLKKSLGFFLIFFICYWFMNISFMLVFGYQLRFVAILLAISASPLLLISIINGFVQEKTHKEPKNHA